jgi:hypothetical protein
VIERPRAFQAARIMAAVAAALVGCSRAHSTASHAESSDPATAAAWAHARTTHPEIAGTIAEVRSPNATRLLPHRRIFSFAAGGLYPIATTGAHVRRFLLVDDQTFKVLLDLDAAQSDGEVATALRDRIPAASKDDATAVAALVATLAPLDPFFPNPGEPAFQLQANAGAGLHAVWAAPSSAFRYAVAFDAGGRLASIERVDHRPKPICFAHRARAQALLDATTSPAGLRAGDVVWDDLTARLIPDHYLYEVRDSTGLPAGLVAVAKGPGAATFVRADRAALLSALRGWIAPARDPHEAAQDAQVIWTLFAHAGAAPRAPGGVPLLDASRASAPGGFQVISQELGETLRFGPDGRAQ